MEVLETQVARFAFNEQGQNHESKYRDSNSILYTSEKKKFRLEAQKTAKYLSSRPILVDTSKLKIDMSLEIKFYSSCLHFGVT